ncbi:MAG: LysM peptidoglycan-binding domain-containing protein [Anaerolineales bacterium]|jgi:LasA protease
MSNDSKTKNKKFATLGLLVLLIASLACARTVKTDDSAYFSVTDLTSSSKTGSVQAAQAPFDEGNSTFSTPSGPFYTPTPDAPRVLPTLRSDEIEYFIEQGDTLGNIAQEFGITWEFLGKYNDIDDPGSLQIGQRIFIPPPTPDGTAPDFKIIPDTELVYGPASAKFDIEDFIQSQGGYLAGYKEEINEDLTLSGAEIVQRIAQDFSVNPRLLLAVLEHQSGWVTSDDIEKSARNYPVGLNDDKRKGLYLQLAYAANNLNRGFYLWRVNGIGAWPLADGSILLISPNINAGTAGIQHFFSTLLGRNAWEDAVSENGLFTTFTNLFGNPFGYASEPINMAELIQPPMQLPFQKGEQWSFTGGPHSAWGDGSAWAALDFAPPGEDVGCIKSDNWVVATADGLITRAGDGAVIQDLDGDGLEQTGWVILYMHIATQDRVEPNTHLLAGQPIGHPSCEGGISSGTHVHIARRYNGEWIPADQEVPFILDRWTSVGTGEEYDGYLERGRNQVEAYAGRSPENIVTR